MLNIEETTILLPKYDLQENLVLRILQFSAPLFFLQNSFAVLFLKLNFFS